MSPGHRLANTIRKIRHNHTLSGRHGDEVNLVSTIIGLLHHREGQCHHLLASAVDGYIAGIVVHAYHLIVSGVDTDRLSAGITSSLKQILVDFLTQHTDFPVLLEIHIIDKSAIIQLRPIHQCIFRSHPLDVNRHLTVFVVGCA